MLTAVCFLFFPKEATVTEGVRVRQISNEEGQRLLRADGAAVRPGHGRLADRRGDVHLP
jgi:hypothetical protein